MSIFSILIAIVVVGIIAALHETGHFLVAKWLGVKVEEFSIFVGPSLFSWKRNGVEYYIRLIPIGAYVRYKGMDLEDQSDTDPDMFFNQPRWKRFLIAIAGPLTNVLTGMLIFLIYFSVSGNFASNRIGILRPDTQLAQTAAKAGDEIISVNGKKYFADLELGYIAEMVGDTNPLSMTLRSRETEELYEIILEPEMVMQYRLGITYKYTYEDPPYEKRIIESVEDYSNNGNPVLKKNDAVLAINGVLIADSDLFTEEVRSSAGAPLHVKIIRDGKEMELEMVANSVETVKYGRGFVLERGYGFAESVRQSLLYPISIVRVSIASIGDMIGGRVKPTEVIAGPVGIVGAVSDVVDNPDADAGVKIDFIINFAGVISIALFFSNMLPIPGLDGNAMVLMLVEMVRGKKLSLKTETIINVVGFVCILALVGFALYSDIFRLVK